MIVACRREGRHTIDFDHLRSAMLAGDNSHGRAWNLEPFGDRAD